MPSFPFQVLGTRRTEPHRNLEAWAESNFGAKRRKEYRRLTTGFPNWAASSP